MPLHQNEAVTGQKPPHDIEAELQRACCLRLYDGRFGASPTALQMAASSMALRALEGRGLALAVALDGAGGELAVHQAGMASGRDVSGIGHHESQRDCGLWLVSGAVYGRSGCGCGLVRVLEIL